MSIEDQIYQEEQFVKFDLALLARQKGFDKPCIMCFLDEEYTKQEDLCFTVDVSSNQLERCEFKKNSDFKTSITAPTYQQLVDWLRTDYGVNVFVDSYVGTHKYVSSIRPVTENGYKLIGTPKVVAQSPDYYVALRAAIKKVINKLPEISK